MQATLTPSTVEFLTQAPATPTAEQAVQAPANAAVRPGFLRDHWELKVLFWGLGLIALAYPAVYGLTYALAAYWPVAG